MLYSTASQGRGRSGVLGDLNERLEAGGILNGDLADHLAVERHAGLDETGHELRVADALGAGSRVDAGDPELTEVALLELAVLGRKAHRAVDGLGSRTEKFGTRSIKALRQFKAAAAAFAGSGCISNTHCILPPSVLKHTLHRFGDALIGHRDTAQITLARPGFVAVEVSLAALRAHNLTRGRRFHALGGALFGFHLRHFAVPYLGFYLFFLTVRAVGLQARSRRNFEQYTIFTPLKSSTGIASVARTKNADSFEPAFSVLIDSKSISRGSRP